MSLLFAWCCLRLLAFCGQAASRGDFQAAAEALDLARIARIGNKEGVLITAAVNRTRDAPRGHCFRTRILG